ncbi:hypothetical protein B296_00017615 [Ensete ventricosum]|uniref:Uncharacterized protein n=1 Tax=Ensete ventricosum TaxID=4639 RepID=A0A427ATM5_ENSVE|nr:hypothetical protein B296_00017615 [Ensete ventricosum]
MTGHVRPALRVRLISEAGRPYRKSTDVTCATRAHVERWTVEDSAKSNRSCELRVAEQVFTNPRMMHVVKFSQAIYLKHTLVRDQGRKKKREKKRDNLEIRCCSPDLDPSPASFSVLRVENLRRSWGEENDARRVGFSPRLRREKE